MRLRGLSLRQLRSSAAYPMLKPLVQTLFQLSLSVASFSRSEMGILDLLRITIDVKEMKVKKDRFV